jgi:hypothetical protein
MPAPTRERSEQEGDIREAPYFAPAQGALRLGA